MFRGRVQGGVVLLDDAASLPDGAEVRVELVEQSRGRSAIQLVEGWLEDQSGYDEEVWPELKSDLDAHRLSARKFYHGEAGSA